MIRWLLISLLILPLSAATTIIDCGSASDSGFTASSAWMIPVSLIPPGTIDVTLRYGPAFAYKIAVDGPQQMTLRFVEPTYQITGQRLFSVSVNNQSIFTDIDLVANAGA